MLTSIVQIFAKSLIDYCATFFASTALYYHFGFWENLVNLSCAVNGNSSFGCAGETW